MSAKIVGIPRDFLVLSYTTSTAWSFDANGTVYVRFKDNADNISQANTARGQSIVYLPMIMR
jgi:hypothetical protein